MSFFDSENHWKWRYEAAEEIAAGITSDFNVKGFYIFGSSKNADSGPASDIDLIIHIAGERVSSKLELYLNTWSHALDYMNSLRTGIKTGGLLDIHYITDSDVEKRDSFAIKIDAVSDGAHKLPLKGNVDE